MKTHKLLLTQVLAMFGAAAQCASDPHETFLRNWPQWRGPMANGTAPHGKPPIRWSETKNVKWKFKIPGFGTSTPIVWEDQVFVLTAIATGRRQPKAEGAAPAEEALAADRQRRRGGGFAPARPTEMHQFVVIAVDRESGRPRWQRVAKEEVPHEGHHRDHGYASASPVTDGEHLYVSFGSRGLFCYDLRGNLRWEKHLGRMRTRNEFGEGASPALHGDTLVVLWDHEGEDFIVALDKRTGAELWRQTREEPTSWSTPLIVAHDGKPQVIVSATNKIRSYDLTTGAQLWECRGMTANVIPTPVAGFGMAYAISGFRGHALLAIRLGRTGDLTGTDAIAWSHNRHTPYVPSPLLSGGLLYFFSGNSAILSCFDARSGEARFDAERIEGLSGVYASPVAAGGHIYLVGREGQTAVMKQGERVDLAAVNRLDDRFDASAAVSGNDLFLRGHQYLYCIAE